MNSIESNGNNSTWHEHARSLFQEKDGITLRRNPDNARQWLRQSPLGYFVRELAVSPEQLVEAYEKHMYALENTFDIAIPKHEHHLVDGPISGQKKEPTLYLLTEHIEGESLSYGPYNIEETVALKGLARSVQAYRSWAEKTHQSLAMADIVSPRQYIHGSPVGSDDIGLYLVDIEPLMARPTLESRQWQEQQRYFNEWTRAL